MTIQQPLVDATTGSVGRYVWHPVEIAEPLASADVLMDRVVSVLGGEDGDRSCVAEALRAAGARVLLIEGAQPEEDVSVVAARTGAATVAGLAAQDGLTSAPVDLIVDLNGCSAPASLTGSWRGGLAQTVAAVQAVYDDWGDEGDARRCGYLAVTRLGGRMGYDGQGITHPLGGVWAGFAKSLPHELPACRVKVLDIGAVDGAELGTLLVQELGVFDYYEVGRRRGERTTLACVEGPAPVPQLELGPEDVVLVSGGARGIGFTFAAALAAEHRCRVVVTGRHSLPDPGEAWLALDDEGFAELQRQHLIAAAGGDVAGARRTNTLRAAARESAANLADAHRLGLSVRYEQCDVQSRDQVHGLVDSLGDRLRVVVHNAGVAAPTRLRGKRLEVVLDVVGCKLEGFLNLADALRGREQTLVCNVGSASGRMGGMVGQVDYAAANEALTRLGFWGTAERGLPVTTMAWTTWDRVGLIANFDAALRYGTALPVDEGIALWSAELLAATPGEVMFLGRVGTALVPTQLAGFLKFTDHPDYPALHSLHHFLGELMEYRPFQSVRSRIQDPVGQPLAAEVVFAGRPVLPVGIALEYAAAAGDWVSPPGWPPRHLAEVVDLTVDLAALVLDTEVQVDRVARGARVEGRWCVDVVMHRGDREMLRARLVYDEGVGVPTGPSAHESPPSTAPCCYATCPRTGTAGSLLWRGLTIPAVAWEEDHERLRGSIRPTRPADLWALPTTPNHALPTNALEGIVAAHVDAAEEPPGVLEARTIRLLSSVEEAQVEGSPATGTWTVRDVAGMPLLALDGVSVR